MKLHKKVETRVIGEEKKATLHIINYYSDEGTIDFYRGILIDNCMVVELKPSTHIGYIVERAKEIL